MLADLPVTHATSRPFISQLFKNLGIETRRKHCHIFTPETSEMIAELHRQGKSYSEIAVKFGCTTYTVGAVMRQLNVPVEQSETAKIAG